MIVGIPKRTLLALPRAFRRTERNETLAIPARAPRAGLFAAFAMMMERQAELIIRGFGD